MMYYVMPSLIEQTPDIAVIHIGCNNIYKDKRNKDQVIDKVRLANEIINVGKICRENNVKDIIISAIFVKRNLELSKIIREVNDLLKDLCVLNGFHFLSNMNISRDFLDSGGVHLSDEGTIVFAGNIVDYIKGRILSVNWGKN